MSLKKQFDKKKPICKVTFKISKETAVSANWVHLVGDFNNWDIESIPMKKHKSGEFSVTVVLDKDREYQYRYLIDGFDWKNDTDADKHVPNSHRTENSVVIV